MNFILELIKRWGGQQPWFFKVVMWLSLATAFFIGLPAFLQDTDIWAALPEAYKAIISKAAFWAGVVGGFIAKLTNTTAEKESRKIPD